MSDPAAAFRDTKSFCEVNDGYQMAYVEMKDDDFNEEKGETLLFLHGNPTSSYLWRNVMAPLQGSGRRLIAPDLIGMGDSDKLTDSSDAAYSFLNHSSFLDTFIEGCVGVEEDDKIILVIHDWGSGLGFYWAQRHPDQVKGIAYMEALVGPVPSGSFTPEASQFFQNVRTPGVGEQMILEQNLFVEVMIPGNVMRNLTEDEMAVYRAPYLNPGEDRRPTLTWPRQVPINGTPAVIEDIVTSYADWMGENDIPKLLIVAEPGALLVGDHLTTARSWKNQDETTVAGIHFIQEDSPDEIAQAIDDWLNSDKLLASDPSVDVSADADSAGTPPISFASGYLYFILVVMLFRKLW